MKQKHFIGKLSLDVQAARLHTATQGFDLQAEISEVVHGDLKAALESLFDRFVSPPEVLKIEQLDIVIPSLPFNDWQKELTPSVLRAIEDALEHLVYFPTAHTVVSHHKIEKTTVEKSLFEAWIFFLKTGQMPQTASNETEWQTISLATVAANAQSVEILRGLLRNNPTVLQRLVLQHTDTFLEALAEAMSGKKQTETMVLLRTFEALWIEPSFMQYLKNSEPSTRDISSISQREIRELFWKMVFKQLAQVNHTLDFPLFIKDFVEQLFNKTWKKNFVSFLSNVLVFKKAIRPKKVKGDTSKKQTIATLSPIHELDPSFIQAIKKASTHHHIAQWLIDFFIKEIAQHTNTLATGATTAITKESEIQNDANTLATEATTAITKELEIQNDTNALATEATTAITKELEIQNDTNDYTTFENKQLQNKDSEHEVKKTEKNDSENDKNENKDSLSESNVSENKAENKAENNTKSNEEETAEETEDLTPTLPQDTNLVASNAGVVLLHPFLKPFFESVNLLKEGKFETYKDRRRAAALMHYLATGKTEMAEYEMALPKLLVGLPLQNPIDRQLMLTDTEHTEAEGLLRAVLNHWKALGSTSPDGLREGFLQRSGKLTHREDGWLLQIESKTLDILIDKLPWGIGIIRLGWMPEMLFVEWH